MGAKQSCIKVVNLPCLFSLNAVSFLMASALGNALRSASSKSPFVDNWQWELMDLTGTVSSCPSPLIVSLCLIMNNHYFYPHHLSSCKVVTDYSLLVVFHNKAYGFSTYIAFYGQLSLSLSLSLCVTISLGESESFLYNHVHVSM